METISSIKLRVNEFFPVSHLIENAQAEANQEQPLQVSNFLESVLGQTAANQFRATALRYNLAVKSYMNSDLGKQERILRASLKQAFLNCEGALSSNDRIQSILDAVKGSDKLNKEIKARVEFEWIPKLSNPNFSDTMSEKGTLSLESFLEMAVSYSDALDQAKKTPEYIEERTSLNEFKKIVSFAKEAGASREDMSDFLIRSGISDGAALAKISYWGKKI